MLQSPSSKFQCTAKRFTQLSKRFFIQLTWLFISWDYIYNPNNLLSFFHNFIAWSLLIATSLHLLISCCCVGLPWRPSGERHKVLKERLLILLLKERFKSGSIPTYWTALFASVPCALQLIRYFYFQGFVSILSQKLALGCTGLWVCLNLLECNKVGKKMTNISICFFFFLFCLDFICNYYVKRMMSVRSVSIFSHL